MLEFTNEEAYRLNNLQWYISTERILSGGLHEIKVALGHLKNVDDKALMHKLIVAGLEIIDTKVLENECPLECHFFYMHAINFYYRHRNDNRGLDNSIYFCIRQIRLAPKTIPLFAEQGPLPSHTGYKQLCIIRYKQHMFDEVVALCEQASQEQWNGDWNERKERAFKKARAV